MSELEDQLHTATRTTQNAIQDARDKDKDMTKLRAHYDKVSLGVSRARLTSDQAKESARGRSADGRR